MKENNYTAGQIREMLDVSRAAVRYYVKKGLISVEKNDENGYQYFDQKNFSDLRDITYLRNILGLGVKDIQNCFNATSPEEYEVILALKSTEILEELRQLRIQLKRLEKWRYYLNFMKEHPNSIQIVEFPQPFVFSQIHPMGLEDTPFLGSSFKLDGQSVLFNSYGYCLDEMDVDAMDEVNGTYYHYPGGKYIYSMFSSDLTMDDPYLVKPALEWAREQGIAVRCPIVVDYFFRIRNQDRYHYYYSVTIPLADCDIRMEASE